MGNEFIDVAAEESVSVAISAEKPAAEIAVKKGRKKFKRWTSSDWTLFCMASLSVVFLAIFAYAPLYGLVLAFKQDGLLDVSLTISKGKWVGFEHFIDFFTNPEVGNIMVNTLGLNILQLCINFPCPIIFAVLTAELISDRFKKTVQTVTFFPHFLSWAVFGGIFLILFDTDMGILASMLFETGIISEKINLLGDPNAFWGIIICTSLLKGMGWGSVIYVAAIAAIPQELYEAAKIDGANRWHKIIYITLPSIAPTITLFFILSVSGILNNGIDHIWVFRNMENWERSEVLDTYIYSEAFENGYFAKATAIGLIKSIVAFLLLIGSNFICKKISGKGIY